MSLDFSLDVHMSSYDKLKEELSIYEMYTLPMAGKKKSIPLHCIKFVVFIHDSFSRSPVERHRLFLYGINMHRASTQTVTWKWLAMLQLPSFLLA